MKIKRFFAKDMRTALKEVKETLGSEAVIMSNKKLADGIELVAAVDENDMINRAPPEPEPTVQMPIGKMMRNQGQPNQPSLGTPAEPANPLMQQPTYQPQPQSQQPPLQSAERPMERPASKMYREASEMDHQDMMDPADNATEEPPVVASSLESLLNRQNQQVKQQKDQSRLNPAFMQSEPPPAQSQASSMGGKTQSGPSSADVELQKQQMATMKTEMESIRKLLTHQVSGLMWQEMERKEPTRAFLITQLKKMGLAEQVADQLACFVPDDLQDYEAWTSVIEMLNGQLNTTNNEILTRGGVFALVGPTGVGKTTTVAKLAARFAQQHGADQVGLVTTDTFRIGAHEQLSTFGKIIGCPVKVAKNAEDLANVLYQMRNRRLILIDTAGMSQRDIRLCEQLTTLMKNSRVKIKSYLVLSATVQYNVLQESVTHFKRIPLAGCIFTKIDECLSLGEIISIAIQNGLPIGYITNGQRVPEDIDVADGGQIITQAETLLKQSSNDQYQWHSDNETQAVGMYD
ncbi:MAG: flagellar biosynthesis protein FlhF [Phenylobacterium sp.]